MIFHPMEWLPSIWYKPSPKAVLSSSTFVLHAGLGFALLVVLLVAWSFGLMVLAIPTLALASIGLVRLFRYPLANLAVVLGLFVLVADLEEGIQFTEVLYGLYYFSFLGHWFITRIFVFKQNILADPEDKAILLLILGISLSIPLTFLFGGEAKWLLSEWTSLMLLAFYFPVKEACIRYKHGAKVVIGVLLWIGLFASVRNAFLYREALMNTEAAWQIVKGRIHFNDNMLMASSLITLVLLTFSRKVRHMLPLIGLFLLLLSGLILTQSRGFWIAFVFGSGLLLLLVDARNRRKLLFLLGTGIACFAIIVLLFLSDYSDLIFLGMVDRLLSISTALANDPSMVNRVRESKAVLDQIIQNPILGYGMGVPYTFFDMVHVSTDQDAFVHNAFLGVWYKFGIWGLGLVLHVWISAVRKGLRAVRIDSASPTCVRAFAAGIALGSLTLGSMTSNPFFLMDGTLLFGLLAGLASGAHRRGLLETTLRATCPDDDASHDGP